MKLVLKSLYFHPVTTDLKNLKKNLKKLILEIKNIKENFVIIYPNNDTGSKLIMDEILKLKNKKIKLIPSMRFNFIYLC